MTAGRRLDSYGVWEATSALPEQLTEALASARDALSDAPLVGPSGIGAVAVFGVGPDALAADAVRAIVTRFIPSWPTEHRDALSPVSAAALPSFRRWS